MVNTFEMSDPSLGDSDHLLREMLRIDLYPFEFKDKEESKKFQKFPLSQMTGLGLGLLPLSQYLYGLYENEGVLGDLYRVIIPPGRELAQFKDEPYYLGAVLDKNGAVGGGQARLMPVGDMEGISFDPTGLVVAAMLMSVDQKLGAILEIQEEILEYLMQKDKSKLKGDLDFLSDILSNFKYNWDNDQYKRSNQVKALDIKQSSTQLMDFYRERIKKLLKAKRGLLADKDIEKQLDKVKSEFKNYQLAHYLFAFSSLADILLLGNFAADYLGGIVDRIKGYLKGYQDLFQESYENFQNYSKSSIQSILIKGLAGASRVTGQTIARVPLLGDTQLDETLIGSGEKLRKTVSKRSDKLIQQLLDVEAGYVQPFIDNILLIKKLHCQEVEFVLDKENIYIELEV
jgi:hypothetical protein